MWSRTEARIIPILRNWDEEAPAIEIEVETSNVGRKLGKFLWFSRNWVSYEKQKEGEVNYVKRF